MTKEELFSVKIKRPDETAGLAAKARWDGLAKPLDGLGDLEGILCKIAAAQGTEAVSLLPRTLLIMCADNGIVEEGVTQTTQEVTGDVAALMGRNKSSVCVMAEADPVRIIATDVGMTGDTPEGVQNKKVCRGTGNFLKGPAMNEETALEAIAVGTDAVSESALRGDRILATGEMGIGNTTTATALLCALTGMEPAACTGRGAGLSDEGLSRKIAVIEEGLKLHFGKANANGASSKEDAFHALCCLGGADIAALAGVFIGAAVYGIPVVIDGLISAVAALLAQRLVPGCKEFMIASHMGKETGMERVMEELGLHPVLHANLALGEGTGALLLFPVLDMALSLYGKGTTFSGADIEAYERYDH